MQYRVFMMLLCVHLTGCMTPPKPADCPTDFRPVNGDAPHAAEATEKLVLCTKEAPDGRQG
jgi:starvation-inducible outer membrane lipoprotein